MAIKLNKNFVFNHLNTEDFEETKEVKEVKRILNLQIKNSIHIDRLVNRSNCLIVEFGNIYFLLQNRHTKVDLYRIGFKEVRLEDMKTDHDWLVKNIFNQNIIIKIDLMTVLALNKG